MTSSPSIAIENLTKSFKRVTAVKDVSFEVRPGEVFGFLGPNGAGKTTALRCLLGFIRPTAGSLRINGSDVPAQLEDALEDVGYVPGEVGFWPWLTGRQCLEYLASLHPRAATRRGELIDRFELSSSDLDRPIRAYSRGMRQKIALVQAFQHSPTIAIMDEPTEGLDPRMQDRFLQMIREFRDGGGTVLMSSHILAEVEAVADRVGIIRKGSLVAVGPLDSIASVRDRHCTVVLREGLDPSQALSIAGVSHLTVLAEGRARFRFAGDIALLVGHLAQLDIADLTIEPPNLSDAFLAFYGDES